VKADLVPRSKLSELPELGVDNHGRADKAAQARAIERGVPVGVWLERSPNSPHECIQLYMADVPPLLAGIDPCFSCNDRMIVVNRRGGDRRIWTREDLRRHASTQTRR